MDIAELKQKSVAELHTLAEQLNISFHIDDFFWSAIGAAIVVTFVSMVLNLVLPDND